MSSVLVISDTGEGQTRRIAERIAATIEEAGHTADAVDVTALPSDLDLAAHDAVVVGGSIHMGRHGAGLVDFVRRHAETLSARPGAFFQVSLSAASDDPGRLAAAEEYLAAFRARTGWEPDLVASLAGALRYSEYGRLKRLLMRRIAKEATGDTDPSRDYEYTDWAAVERFAAEVAALAGDASAEPPAPPIDGEGDTRPEADA